MGGEGFQVGQCIQECIQRGALVASSEQGHSNILGIILIPIGFGMLLLLLDGLSRWRENVCQGKQQ